MPHPSVVGVPRIIGILDVGSTGIAVVQKDEVVRRVAIDLRYRDPDVGDARRIPAFDLVRQNRRAIGVDEAKVLAVRPGVGVADAGAGQRDEDGKRREILGLGRVVEGKADLLRPVDIPSRLSPDRSGHQRECQNQEGQRAPMCTHHLYE